MTILNVNNLSVSFSTRYGHLDVLDNISFSIDEGEILGLVGESGAGKSLTAHAINGLLEPPGILTGGSILFENERIDTLPKEQMRRLRGRRIGTIFQYASTSLNPLFSVGHQLVETILTHLSISHRDAQKMALEMLTVVGIASPEERIFQYQHQFSGGMKQRVAIALALCANPKLLIADEPTSSLDAAMQIQIIQILKKMCRDNGTAVLLITHDIAVTAEVSDRLVVMYAGNIVENGPTKDILATPLHPYTLGLINSIPAINAYKVNLQSIEGSMPGLRETPSGCTFHPRCPKAIPRCSKTKPQMTAINATQVACLLYEEDR